MTESHSVPTSIRTRLEQARALHEQDRPREAEVLFRDTCVELARTHPELCALIMSAKLGYPEIIAIVEEVTTEMRYVERNFFGIPLFEAMVPRTTTRITTKTMRLSK